MDLNNYPPRDTRPLATPALETAIAKAETLLADYKGGKIDVQVVLEALITTLRLMAQPQGFR